MVPSFMVLLERISLTPNGKVDLRALPQPESVSIEEYTAPRDALEAKLVGLWAEILGRDVLHVSQLQGSIGIDDNFFDLGGHSLKATVLASRIHKELKVILPLGEIFKAPTIRNLSEYIKNTGSHSQPDIGGSPVLIREGLPGGNHLFFIHDGSGEVEGYVEFCKQLTNNFNCWGIRADRLENLAPRNVTVRELAETYIHSMKKIQPHGPYYIAGWSLGGTIAFEITAQLEQTDAEIAFLALIDSPAPHKRIWKDAVRFNLESEFNFIKRYGIGSEFDETFKNSNGIVFDQFWSNVVDYLKINNVDVEMIKKSIGEFGMHVLPNYHRLSLEESVYYLNAGRTLRNARAHYTPGGKLNSQLHYFKASQSKMIAHHQWEKYCRESIKYNTIPGDHFSIFRVPDVVKFAKLFREALDAAKEKANK
jgi:fengycin family lipopeptide synthetase D/gramicidin S synthase 2/tyrocidine synthetase-3